ncbi:MAG: hypothetical protein WC554_02055 [Clostridia bacterium]
MFEELQQQIESDKTKLLCQKILLSGEEAFKNGGTIQQDKEKAYKELNEIKLRSENKIFGMSYLQFLKNFNEKAKEYKTLRKADNKGSDITKVNINESLDKYPHLEYIPLYMYMQYEYFYIEHLKVMQKYFQFLDEFANNEFNKAMSNIGEVFENIGEGALNTAGLLGDLSKIIKYLPYAGIVLGGLYAFSLFKK